MIYVELTLELAMSLFCKIICTILISKHSIASGFIYQWKYRTMISTPQVAKPPFKINLDPISEGTKQISIEELRETPQIVAQGLKELRELLENDKSIHYETDDDFLIIFLRPCKYYAKSAYELMKRIAEFRAKHKNILDGLLPVHERVSVTNSDVVNVLTTKDHKGRRILILNVGGKWDPYNVKTDQVFRILYLLHLVAMIEPETQVRGAIVIMDCHNMGMKQVTNLTPGFVTKLLTFIQDAMPLRIKEVHIINNPGIFSIVWRIIRPLLKEKLSKRTHLHDSKMSSLHEFIPPSHLPKDYGGDLPEINYTSRDWYPAVQEQIDHIKKWNSCGIR